ncbi:hypothetical protein [Moraxella lacunata]|uniref:Rad52/22 family double-strand break repair protein n=1 Tax=Moraxella lacunata TaxID=477 RepID=A0A1V4GWH4_MORLA|nr:hypothetical protein [Moraxella lacunata]OPH36748.1 hypothetical protein B5J94_06800 [Moraxella lacunata]
MDNLSIWNKVKQVPPQFLKPIGFGKLKGKSDINPQWRLMAMTQAFGAVGHGWNYRIVRTWSEPHPNGSVMCFAEVAVQTKLDGEWGKEFSGIGGSEIIESNKNGLQSNDDGYKMAVTDALSVAFKAVGVAGDIYLGNFDGSKYVSDLSQAFDEPISQDDYDSLMEKINSLSEQGRNTVANALNQRKLKLLDLPKSQLSEFWGFLNSVGA